MVSVLIVEDLVNVRQLLFRILSMRGYLVFEAENGEQALSVISEQKALDVLISDFEFPLGDPNDIARAFRTKNPRALRIGVTGADPERFDPELFQHRLMKPVQPPKITALIEDYRRERA